MFLQLLRYACTNIYNQETQKYEFDTDKVKRPIKLNEELSVQDHTYKLRFITFHIGSQASEGHYNCLIKDAKGSWHKMNDGTSKKDKLPAASQAATVLVYERADDTDKSKMCQQLEVLRARLKNKIFKQPERKEEGEIVRIYLDRREQQKKEDREKEETATSNL